MFNRVPTFHVGADIYGLRIFYVSTDVFMNLEYFMGANILGRRHFRTPTFWGADILGRRHLGRRHFGAPTFRKRGHFDVN